jgi:hypothetical protein
LSAIATFLMSPYRIRVNPERRFEGSSRIELRSCGQEVRRAQYRTGDQMREEGQVEREGPKRVDRREAPEVDVERVAQRHESVERDPDREHDVETMEPGLDPERGECALHAVEREVRVLEVREQPELAG